MRPKIYLHSLEPTTDLKSCASEEQQQLQGDSLFLLTTVFYIQTNKGAGRKIMRDSLCVCGVKKEELVHIKIRRETMKEC